MDRQARIAKGDLECMFFDESLEAKALPLSLLHCITDDFSNNNEIGRGGFAVVYKGLLGNGAVAVKKLFEKSDTDERKFHGEVDCLMKAKHKNIVRFLGYCSDTQGQWIEVNGKSVMADVRRRLLCFEYLPNGSLDKYIKDTSLEWGMCYQIIKGICEGLHYLHEKQIVHSDLKPANILLDDDMMPKITDFGLSRCFDGNQTHVVTSKIVGTVGYFAPEFFNGKISFKSDIYSLGVIIIEILTGEKGYPDVDKVLECWRHKVERSHEEKHLGQIRVCTEVGQSCLEPNPVKRPCAQGIIKILEQTESKECCIEIGESGSAVPLASSLVENENKNQSSSSTVPHACSLVENENKNLSSSSAIPQARSLIENENKNRSSSSQARSLVANKNKSTVESNVNKIEASKRTTTVDSARTCEVVKQAICELYAQGTTGMPFEKLHSDAYNMVIHEKGEELYSAVEIGLSLGVQSLWRSLDADPEDNPLFLQELLGKWNHHIKVVKMTRYMLMCMERTFVPTNFKTPIYELGLHMWRDHLAHSGTIRKRLIEAMRQRRDNYRLISDVKEMFTELGEDVACFFFPETVSFI